MRLSVLPNVVVGVVIVVVVRLCVAVGAYDYALCLLVCQMPNKQFSILSKCLGNILFI